MILTFTNPNIAITKDLIRFAGETRKGVTVVCSVSKSAIRAYSRIDRALTDEELCSAFRAMKPLLEKIAAARWAAGIRSPTITLVDLESWTKG